MADEFDIYIMKRKLDKAEKELAEIKEENKVLMQECDRLIKEKGELLKGGKLNNESSESMQNSK